MRAIVVSDFVDSSGGSHRVAAETALALSTAGADVDLMHSGTSVDPRLMKADIRLRDVRLPDVKTMGVVGGACNYLWSTEAFRRCRAVFAQIRDSQRDVVVHVHSFSRCFTPSVFAAANAVGLPVVLTLHDYFVFSQSGLYYDFLRKENLDPRVPVSIWRKTDRRISVQLLRMARLRVLRHLCARGCIDHYIAVSQACQRIASHSVCSSKVTVVYSPVAPLGGKAVPWQKTNLVFVGRLSEEKGVVALAQIAKEMGIPVRFVGDGPDAAAIKREYPSAVVTGWLDADGVREELLNARALVLPSRWCETFGICVAEAQSLGVPVVVSGLAGSAEWVKHGKDGYVFDPYSATELTDALSGLTEEQTVRSLGTRGFESFNSRNCDHAEYASRVLSVYERVLPQHRVQTLVSIT